MLDAREIRAALVRIGLSQADLARRVGCWRTAVASTISGNLKTPYIRRGIAEAIGLSYEVVWGVADPVVDRLPSGRRPVGERLTGVNHFTPEGEGST